MKLPVGAVIVSCSSFDVPKYCRLAVMRLQVSGNPLLSQRRWYLIGGVRFTIFEHSLRKAKFSQYFIEHQACP